MVLSEQIRRLGLTDLVNQLMPQAPRNRAYQSSTVFNTLMLMMHDGASCLDDVRPLQQESALMRMPGIKRIPVARSAGNGLRAMGRCQGAKHALNEVNRKVLKAALHGCKKVTLDLDATMIESHRGQTHG